MVALTVCIPTYNREGSIARALDSVLRQTFDDFECLVIDNCSQDATIDIVQSFKDPRIRVVHNTTNIGWLASHNKAISLGRGRLFQFVHSDDWLYPHCLQTLATLFDNPSVGLAFARRKIDTNYSDWAERYANLHIPFGALSTINSGQELVARYVRGGASGNWIGEPTSVMLRRDIALRVGGFSPLVKDWTEMDVWLRILARSDAGWVDEELAVRWHHDHTLTIEGYVGSVNPAWLDQLSVVAAIAMNQNVAVETRRRATRLWMYLECVAVSRALRARGGRTQKARELVGQLRSVARLSAIVTPLPDWSQLADAP